MMDETPTQDESVPKKPDQEKSSFEVDWLEVVYVFMLQNPKARIPVFLIGFTFGVFLTFFTVKYCWFVAIPFLKQWGFAEQLVWWKMGLAGFGMIYPGMGGLFGLLGFYPAILAIAAINGAQMPGSKPKAFEVYSASKVFVVHGHDEAAKLSASRYLEHLSLEPIVLHEQLSRGDTIIEKFEKNAATAGFAIVLLTPDDLGAEKENGDSLKSRARQNVVLELGYFVGKLGRDRVAVLVKGDVEIPSDYMGVIYTKMDDAGGWKLTLAQELKEAKMKLNMSGLI